MTSTLALETLVLTLAILAPDFLLNRKWVFGVPRKALGYAVLIAVISFSIVANGSDGIEAAVVTGLFLVIIVWHLCHAYFGDVLRPEAILLLVKPDHLRDAAEVASKEYSRFLGVIAAVVVPFVVAVTVVIWATPEGGLWPGVWLATPAIIAVMGLSAAFKSGGRGAYPKLHMPGVIGGIHALSLALKWGVSGVRALPGEVSYRFGPPTEKPCTVAVVMGESIAVDRMGLYRPGLATTPNLERLAAASGPLSVIARTGFAAAVSSNASVAGFLDGSPYPWQTTGARTLFDLARQQGFRTAYLSSQVRSPLDVLGGASFIDRIRTQDSDYDLFVRRRDWMLKDFTAEVPGGERDFLFYYHRCNHSPYYDHDVGLPQDVIYPRPKNDAEVIANYDAGMRVYDRMITDLVEEISTRDGDVFVFVTSDHNEMLGQSGVWGHSFSGMVAGALVPMMLVTNRPDHPVARAFRNAERLDAFSVASFAMALMGVTPVADNGERFYVGNALPRAMAGYMSAACDGRGGLRIDHHDRNGTLLREEELAPGALDPSGAVIGEKA